MWKWVIGRIRPVVDYRPRRQDFRGLATCGISLLAAFPVAMLWMAYGPFTVYPPKGFIDPWFYTGYFSHFHYLLTRSGITYYVSRLPWILPGRLAFGIAGGQWGSLLLSAGLLTLGAVSLYWIVRWHYGGAPAALAAVAWCTNPCVMATVGWQYPDGPVLAYGMAGLALYLRPTGNRRWNSFWAAALLVLAGATNLSGSPLILAIVTVPLWRCRRSWTEFLKEAACSAMGAGAAALALSQISQAVLGSPRFLQPQIDQTMYALHTPGYLASMWGTGPGFLTGAVRLFPPEFLLLFGPVLLIAVRKPAAAAWPLYLALCICCALYAVQEFVLHGAALRVYYHSSYMMVLVLAFAGAALGEVWPRSPGGGRTALVFAAAMGVGLVAASLVFNTVPPSPPGGRTWVWLALVGACGLALAIVAHWPRLPVQFLTCALILAILFLSSAVDPFTFGYVWTGQRFPHASNLTSNANADDFRHLMNLEKFLASNLDASRLPEFWWDTGEPDFDFFKSAAALFLCGHEEIAQGLRSGDMALMRYFFPGNRTFVHLTIYPERIAGRNREMTSHGIVLGNERRAAFEYRGRPVAVVIEDVIDSSRLH
jgi:hypothetical protein